MFGKICQQQSLTFLNEVNNKHFRLKVMVSNLFLNDNKKHFFGSIFNIIHKDYSIQKKSFAGKKNNLNEYGSKSIIKISLKYLNFGNIFDEA